MRVKCILMLLAFLPGLTGSLYAGAVPREVAGFALGDTIAQYEDRVRMNTVLPTRYFESFFEVEIQPHPGFKSGLIGYGTCSENNRILRIRLKYQDSSKKFYDELLRRFKQRFGKPDEWRGDPFHVMVAWKWSFKNAKGDNISLILQHNIQDAEQKQGNVVKLANTSAIFREHECNAETRAQAQGKARPITGAKNDWQNFIPR